MKICELRLERFRKFKDLKIALHKDFNVIIGANGSGKTTLLEAMGVALGSFFITMQGSTPTGIENEDAFSIITESHDLLTSEPAYPVIICAEGEWADTKHVWTRSLTGPENKTTHGEAGSIKARAAELLEALRSGEAVELPLLAYYDAKGMRTARRENKIRDVLGSRTDGYRDCLAGEANIKWLRQWMMEQELSAFQGNPRVPHLDGIERAVLSCVGGERDARRFRYDAKLKDLVIQWEDGRVEPLSRLSAGYQRVISLAVDLAWRACTLNPAWGAEAPSKIEGVVMIDELDMHLHPAWQHRVIDDLRRTFPKLQWITTTHSPTLLTHTRREWLRILSAEETQEVKPFRGPLKGREIDDILLHVMGVSKRDEETQAKLHVVAAQIESGELEAARRVLSELRAQLGEGDVDVMRLSWELDWKVGEE